jgi:hypothetical protein
VYNETNMTETTMLLTDLLMTYKPIYPKSAVWTDTFALFEADPNEMQVVNDLVDELSRNDYFREPIILSDDTDDPDIEEDERTGPIVGNGTHRVYASYLVGKETVYVQHGWTVHEEISDEEEYPMTGTIITLTGEGEPFTDDDFDNIITSVRSIRVSETEWLESDMFFGLTQTSDCVLLVRSHR